ncbi:phosphoglycerate mutase [Panacagrimonas perspica]|uniref:Phosphoglycerate mutase n=1 Tax=Panacagrimonas perspica TaxID=381431 RepID=A0A4S3JZT2_9GAMM|nr:alkaline phosphatase family protein [Panacagrimonas perspica]TDU32156.1 phosphoglycerate mutase [Panacagrimonas perspica]THD01142.1 phosphoglycerate mutase [Panacagrimonas perspica]
MTNKPIRYGEDQPRLDDDRLPIVLVLLDGLGDRPIPELDHRTPSEAAKTPVLDRLTRRGASGWHIPMGWGRAPSSELAHWAMFGFSDVPFPGRAVLEAIGAGIDVPFGVATTFASLRTSEVADGRVWITGRAARDDMPDADALLAELTPFLREQYGVRLDPMGRGEALMQFGAHAKGGVTDSDPFFEHLHPWLKVRAIGATTQDLADDMNRVLLAVRCRLMESPVNRRRVEAGRPALDVLSTKWSGARERIPDFVEQTGVAGAAVTDSRMYRGLAGLLGMRQRHLAPKADYAADLAERIRVAEELIRDGAQFVHVHTKVTDEAGHTKNPFAKRDALEALDPGLAGLEALADQAIVMVTGDHATPSVHGVLHTGDPTPLLLVGPTVRADEVVEFGERPARQGWFGVVQAHEVMPLLFNHANRPMFLGHRATPRQTLALPDQPEPMRLE